jgi:hypothetical protein
MAEKSGQGAFGKYLGAPIGGALTALLTWATAGSTSAKILAPLLAVVGGGLALAYRRYFSILVADQSKPVERRAYRALRNSLAKGNWAARLYSRWLTAFLDAVDRLFGDADRATRAFGLKTPKPLWTAAAFDRCLLLAAIYPIAVMFVIWAVTGHVGPAEKAFHIERNLFGWQRAVAAAAVACAMFAAWRAYPTNDRLQLAWLIFGLCIGAASAGLFLSQEAKGAIAWSLEV